MCIKLILEMFIWLAGYVSQVMSFIINPKPIFALTELKVIIASCIVFSPQQTNSLFLKLSLWVCLQCNVLLFLKFKEFKELPLELKMLTSAEHKVKQGWVSVLNVFSLAVYTFGCELHTFITYGDKMGQHYFMFSYKHCYESHISVLNCPPTNLGEASLSLQATLCSFQMSRVG